MEALKCEGALPTEFRSFAVDPQITSLDVLHHILIRAFELNRKYNFGMSYLCRDHSDSNYGEGEVYLSLLSDLDLDTAFARSAEPCLLLKMDIKPAEDSPLLEGWDIISSKDVIGSDLLPGERRGLATAALPFTQSLLSQVGRTLSRVQQALSWSYVEELKPFKPPLSDSEFHSFLNSQGQLCHPEELRLRIYHGGVEPSLRKVVWRYLLNVYPDGLTGQERMDYMKRKSREYELLKKEWTARIAPSDLDLIRSNVMKDVLRTDRTHPYYAGSEDNPHLTAMANLLTTYAITHPQVSYCQGMSDIASPILAVMDNEAHAYICFCSIMKRLEGNFAPDGRLMTLKFGHLRLLLERCEPDFYAYLKSRGADGLLFCYRWLLLELKREFAFEHALRMLEPGFGEFKYYSAHKEDSSDPTPPLAGVQASEESWDDAGERVPLITPPLAEASRRNLPNSHTGAPLSSPSLPNMQAAPAFKHTPSASVTNRRPPSLNKLSGRHASPPSASNGTAPTTPATSTGSGLSVSRAPSPLEAVLCTLPTLPSPQELGQGNPFMLFLCVSLLLEQRAHVMQSGLDHNELAMHFDRLVRRHSLAQVLHRARALFADYLQSEVWDSELSDEVSLECPSPPVRPHPLQAPSGSTSPNSTYKLTNTVPSAPSVCPLRPPS
ncbi:hypothetical protein SKAU_G00101720 [Synaphobranchus kaupii]|uniref:Rab-GAP TBC domain-containing protein n=1 Tax=Synaphobranchus kaupii TaxID=118154 RepID=A0A9Q1J766_SYNKA|nr:hypothetical protein SKAU_G00101720 [Synaphobranchus kaupii]